MGPFDLEAAVSPDVASWWSLPGRAGFTDQSWLGAAYPRTLAGFTAGAWSQELTGRIEPNAPYPGVLGISPMLAGLDSLAFIAGDGAWAQGFDATLATASAVSQREGERRTRAVVRLGGGSFGYDDNALAIERGDSLRWLRFEVASSGHGIAGPLGLTGSHLWQVAGSWTRRSNRLSAAFGQRGTATSVTDGEEQSAAGAAGSIAFRHERGAFGWGVGFDRGYDRHESFGGLLDPSRRDAQANRGAVDAEWSGGRFELGARASAGTAEVHRQGADAFASVARWGWGAASLAMRLGPGRAEAALGAGRHDTFGVTEIAPAFGYRIGNARWQARAGVERALWAVWTDLEPGSDPFLQSTWVGVLEGRVSSSALALHGTVLSGKSRDRALIARAPIEDLWLRDGFHADPGDYTFTLVALDGAWHGRRVGVSAEGFALARTRSEAQPNVDPGWGARVEADYRRAYFKGDLGVRMHAGFEAIGARESDGIASQTLPAYATSIAGVVATLASAIVTFEARNLEDRLRSQTWLDTSTDEPAMGSGRELRFLVTLRLMN